MKYFFILFSFLLIIGSSCRQISKSISDTLNNHPTDSINKNSSLATLNTDTAMSDTDGTITENSPSIFISDTAALQEAEDALRNRPEFKGKNIMVYRSLHFYDNHRVLVDVQNPDNPAYADEYYYNEGKWDEPKPIRLSKYDDVSKDLISLDRLPFKNAFNVYKALKEKGDEINATEPDFSVYVVTYGRKIKWYPSSISNTRYNYSISFNSDGTLRSFDKE